MPQRGEVYYLKVPLNLKRAQQHLSLCIFLPLSWFEGINLRGPCMYNDLLYFRGRSGTWSCYELTHTFPISKQTTWLRGKDWKLQGAPRRWAPGSWGEDLWTKPAKSDSTKEAVIRPGVLYPQERPWDHNSWYAGTIEPWSTVTPAGGGMGSPPDHTESLLCACPCQLILSLLPSGW